MKRKIGGIGLTAAAVSKEATKLGRQKWVTKRATGMKMGRNGWKRGKNVIGEIV
jgi:hypothetical protein